MSKPKSIQKELDALQVSFFQTLFKWQQAEHGSTVAFATAIADTSDDVCREAIARRPGLVAQWVERYSHKRKKGKNQWD